MLSSNEPSAAVLVVDDDADTRVAIRDVLTAEGYRVSCACSCDDALAALATEPPAVVLIHLMWAREGGRELVARLSRGDRLDRPAVLVLTAHRDSLELEGGGTVDACLRKPVELHELLTTVARLASPKAHPGARG